MEDTTHLWFLVLFLLPIKIWDCYPVIACLIAAVTMLKSSKAWTVNIYHLINVNILGCLWQLSRWLTSCWGYYNIGIWISPFSVRGLAICFFQRMATLYFQSRWLFHTDLLPYPAKGWSLLASPGPQTVLMTGSLQAKGIGKDAAWLLSKVKKGNESSPRFLCVIHCDRSHLSGKKSHTSEESWIQPSFTPCQTHWCSEL